jgi:hypothetical protein
MGRPFGILPPRSTRFGFGRWAAGCRGGPGGLSRQTQSEPTGQGCIREASAHCIGPGTRHHGTVVPSLRTLGGCHAIQPQWGSCYPSPLFCTSASLILGCFLKPFPWDTYVSMYLCIRVGDPRAARVAELSKNWLACPFFRSNRIQEVDYLLEVRTVVQIRTDKSTRRARVGVVIPSPD